MSGGSDASILGYGNQIPFQNVNPHYVNTYSTNNPANFTSNIIPGNPPGPLPGLVGSKNNVDAALGIIGGRKNNIFKKYKMHKKHFRSKRKGNSKRKTNKSHTKTKRRHSHSMKRKYRGGFASGFPAPSGVTNYPAGYGQYQNNLPSTPSYAVGGILSGNAELGLANPPPITRMPNSNVDNYNHYKNTTYESRGH